MVKCIYNVCYISVIYLSVSLCLNKKKWGACEKFEKWLGWGRVQGEGGGGRGREGQQPKLAAGQLVYLPLQHKQFSLKVTPNNNNKQKKTRTWAPEENQGNKTNCAVTYHFPFYITTHILHICKNLGHLKLSTTQTWNYLSSPHGQP